VSRPRRKDELIEAIEQLKQTTEPYGRSVRGPLAWSAALSVWALWLLSMVLARRGTPLARVEAGLLLVASAVVAFEVWRRVRRGLSDPRYVLVRLRDDAARAGAALRALALAEEGGGPGVSRDLVSLHLARSAQAVPPEGVFRAGKRRGRVFALVALGAMALGASACVGAGPFRIIEGADVLVARAGRAPVALAYVDDVAVVVRPPEYLHRDEARWPASSEIVVPKGATLTVRGRTLHPGQPVALSDGHTEIPFVDDGDGHLSARYVAMDDRALEIIARFADVTVADSITVNVRVLPDLPPRVVLEGAPLTVRVADAETDEVPVRYQAEDDHGLREVNLVLRAGAREERRVLSRLDGETRTDRGGQVVRLTDPFVRGSHVPVEITIEAKDNDTVSGPKWGKSAPITIVPPAVGEAEQKRLAMLRGVRDAAVDVLAEVLRAPGAGSATHKADVDARHTKLKEALEQATQPTMLGRSAVGLPANVRRVLRAQLAKVSAPTLAYAKAPSTGTLAAYVRAHERLTLVIDAAVQGQGLKDAKDVSKRLADVADDLVLASLSAQAPSGRTLAEGRMDVDQGVLSAGGSALGTLGGLGHDLGELTTAYVRRVARARGANNFLHAELAARDLAMRLREPDASFGSKGGSSSLGAPSTESGGGDPSSSGDSAPSDADNAFQEAAGELDKITQDHGGQTSKVDRALDKHASPEDVAKMKELAKKGADAIREAVKGLPQQGVGDTWDQRASQAREQAQAAARALEEGDTTSAEDRGQRAADALDKAQERAQLEDKSQGDGRRSKLTQEAKDKLRAALDAVKKEQAAARKGNEGRARPDLQKVGEDEGKLAERMRKLGQKGEEQGQDALPQPSKDALRKAEEAARRAQEALKQGDSAKAKEQQQRAQENLQAAREALGNDEESASGKEGDRATPGAHADIPGADAHKGPEEFRKRVLRGLGQGSNTRYDPALKRYVEGLLR
jgi:hypothetical protein